MRAAQRSHPCMHDIHPILPSSSVFCPKKHAIHTAVRPWLEARRVCAAGPEGCCAAEALGSGADGEEQWSVAGDVGADAAARFRPHASVMAHPTVGPIIVKMKMAPQPRWTTVMLLRPWAVGGYPRFTVF